jgi:hypothetical protein
VFCAAFTGVAANAQTQLTTNTTQERRGIVVSTTETQKQQASQDDPGDAAGEEQQNGGSGAKKALKIGGLAAAAGTAAFAASKAMGSRGKTNDDDDSESSKDGAAQARGGRVSTEQIFSAIGSARWDVLRDIVVPIAENGARSAGAYVAKEGPEFLSESLVPKFIDGFNEGQEQRSGSGRK